MSSFNASEYISYIFKKNENTSSGRGADSDKNNAFAGSVAGDRGGFSANQPKP